MQSDALDVSLKFCVPTSRSHAAADCRSACLLISALRQRGMVRLNVIPTLDLELTLDIVERSGRMRVPAATRAFGRVRAFFAAVAARVATLRELRPTFGREHKRSG